MRTLLLALLLFALPLHHICAQAPPKSKAATPHRMVGKWSVNHIGGSIAEWEFKEGGALSILSGVGAGTSCTWEKEKDAIKITYPDGKVTTLEWPIKNGKTVGHDAGGGKLWLTEGK